MCAGGTDQAFEIMAQYDLERMKRMDAYIALRGTHNINEASGIPSDRMQAQSRIHGIPVHMKQRLNHTKWCVLRWPTPAMAQLAGMNTEAFEDFYFDVCTLDYGRMAEAAEKLVAVMNETDQVHIQGPGDTDLRFSIKDIPARGCAGNMNIPDGEVFTAPVKRFSQWRDSIQHAFHLSRAVI